MDASGEELERVECTMHRHKHGLAFHTSMCAVAVGIIAICEDRIHFTDIDGMNMAARLRVGEEI